MGVGQIELVLSILFQVLTNIVRDQSREGRETVQRFKEDYLERSIGLSFRLLLANQGRRVSDEDEEAEKAILSLAIVAFLKFITLDNTIAPVLLKLGKQHDILRRLLQFEQENTLGYDFSKTPIDVEATVVGLDMHDLKRVVAQGNAALHPYNYVSFRVVNQIANLLQYEKHKDMFAPNNAELCILGEELIDTAREKFKERCAYERMYWSDFDRDLNENVKEAMDKTATAHHEE